MFAAVLAATMLVAASFAISNGRDRRPSTLDTVVNVQVASLNEPSSPTTTAVDDRAAITRAALGGIMSQGTDDPDTFIDRPEGIKAQRDTLAAAYPEQRNAKLVMKTITIDTPTTATFVYDVELAPPLTVQSLHDMTGHAVKVDGAWKVTRATACQVWGFGTGTCPALPATPTAGGGTPALRNGVLYGTEGLRLVDGGVAERNLRVVGPITAAFRLSDGPIIYQRADSNGAPAGPITQRIGTRDVAILNSGPNDKLLDVTHNANGHWQALISRRTGNDPPDTIALLLYDLDDDTTREINRTNGWEFGYANARVTPSGVLYVAGGGVTQRYGVFRNDGARWHHDGAPDHDAFVAVFEPSIGTIILSNQPGALTVDADTGDTTRSTPTDLTCQDADLAPSGIIACTTPDGALVTVDLNTGAAQRTAQSGSYTFTRS